MTGQYDIDFDLVLEDTDAEQMMDRIMNDKELDKVEQESEKKMDEAESKMDAVDELNIHFGH